MQFWTRPWLIAAAEYVVCASYSDVHDPGQNSFLHFAVKINCLK